jgi:PAS domain S-box-containing protein
MWLHCLFLIAAGLAGNYLSYPLFIGIDFLFGSIFAMLALQLCGQGRGILAAALIASCTFVLWSHPYAIVIMTLEVAVAGWLVAHRKIGLVLADTLYWLILGMPLVYFFYVVVMDVSLGSAYMIMIKQAVNGIANALLGRLIFVAVTLRTCNSHIPLRDVIYNLLAFFALVPVLTLLMVDAKSDFVETDRSTRTQLQQDNQRLTNQLDQWMQERSATVLHLTQLAKVLTAQQMQTRLDQARASDVNFLRIGMRDTESVITAYSPQIDEAGQPNVGRKFSERPYIAELKRTLKPMFTEVVMGRIGAPKPVAILLAPVMRQGGYGGYINTVLSLDRLKDQLDTHARPTSMLYTLVDKVGNVILTNRKDQHMMEPFVRGAGDLKYLSGTISQWMPALPHQAAVFERWKNSFYVSEAPVSKLADWKLILEQPLAPFQERIFAHYADALALLFALLIVTLALAEFLSRRVVEATQQLSATTHKLSAILDADPQPTWSSSTLLEPQQFIVNFREMGNSLLTQFQTIRRNNATLERRVAERTSALEDSEKRYRTLVEWSPEAIAVHREGIVVYVNPAAITMMGATSAQDLLGKSILDFVHPQYRQMVIERSRRSDASDASSPLIEEKFLQMDGTVIDVEVQNTGIIFDGKPAIQVAGRDVTARNLAESALRDNYEALRSILLTSLDGFFQVDCNGYLREVNATYCEQSGYSREELIGMHINALDAVESADQTADRISQLLLFGRDQFETLHRRKDGSIWFCEVSATFCRVGGGVLFAFLRDITARTRVQEQLSIAACAFESQAGIMVTDAGSVILKVNRAFTAITGYASEEAVGQTPRLLKSDRHDANFYRGMWETLEQTGAWKGEIWDKRKTGEVYPINLAISAVKNGQGVVTHYIGAFYDITERKDAENALRALNQRLAESQQNLRALAAQTETLREEERKHVAREVHDELGQVMTTLRINLSALAMRFGQQTPALIDDVQGMKVLVDRAIQGVRNVALNLRPAALDMGLIPAIQWLAKDFSQHHAMVCAVRALAQDIELDESRAVVIFRIVQESLTNISRHARATQVDISIQLNGTRLAVMVLDNGAGFDPNLPAPGKSFGLLGMRERAIALGGRVDVVSAPGMGTVIGLSIPVNFDIAEESI